MVDWMLGHELSLRLATFGAVFCVMAVWELVAARRHLTASKKSRWIANLGIVVLDAGLVRLLFPAAAVGGAVMATDRGWGLLNNVAVPDWAAIVLAVVILDFALWALHLVVHAVPILWRLHMVHHADVDFDVTSGVRFHPIEVVLSLLIKLAVVIALGAPAVAVFLFEVLLNATAMFSHGNVRLSPRVDAVLRWIVVTPDMHRVHHSTARDETHTNFGFNLPWWDRLLGTYRAQPRRGHEGMVIGLDEFRSRSRQTLRWMLTLPFGGVMGGAPMRRRIS